MEMFAPVARKRAEQGGYLVGRFNSPHLLTPRDSIRINNHPCPLALFAHAEEAIATHDSFGCTSFERLTAQALWVFEHLHVDIAVLEVGMGGTLDATNAIPPDTVLACGIAAVDFDHQAFLGNSIQSIARHKAGIAKPRVVCVVGEQRYDEAVEAIREEVGTRGGEVIWAPSSTVRPTSTAPAPPPANAIPPPRTVLVNLPDAQLRTTFPLHGTHQLSNASLAVTILTETQTRHPWLHLTSTHFARGISKTRWAGRLTWFSHNGTTFLADGAHNPSSASALSSYLSPLFPHPRKYILSLSYSPTKLPEDVFKQLLRPSDIVAIVPFSTPVDSMPWVKPAETPSLVTAAAAFISPSGTVSAFPSLQLAIEWITHTGDPNAPVVVSGSLYLVADLYRLVGTDPNC
ncbi:folylpolyglutamate synthase [Tulasnella sp. 403]|nr:folylpolyglutamate synthase [Tulasnella sp. 403]